MVDLAQEKNGENRRADDGILATFTLMSKGERHIDGDKVWSGKGEDQKSITWIYLQ